MLVNESAAEAQQFFLHQGTLTIGRAAPDIGIVLTVSIQPSIERLNQENPNPHCLR